MAASLCWRTVVTMVQSWRAPFRNAFSTGMPEASASGVNRNSGSAPTAKIPAAIRATTRSCSWVAVLRPNSGCLGTQAQSTLPGRAKAQAVKPSAKTENRFPSAKASPEAMCAPFMPAARINSELCKTSENENPIPISIISSMVVKIDNPLRSGLAHHSATIIGTIAATIRPSHSLRRPSWSIEAPKRGAVAITIQP